METNVVNKKKGSVKPKKAVSARQYKKEAAQRNISAAVSAVAKYNTKTAH